LFHVHGNEPFPGYGLLSIVVHVENCHKCKIKLAAAFKINCNPSTKTKKN
jgi:hypothetical protein